MEGLAFLACTHKFAFVGHHLMPQLFFKGVYISFGVLQLHLYLLTDPIGELIEVHSDEIKNLFLIDLVAHLHLIILIIKCLIKIYLIVVSFSLLVGQMININAHRE